MLQRQRSPPKPFVLWNRRRNIVPIDRLLISDGPRECRDESARPNSKEGERCQNAWWSACNDPRCGIDG
jgi:hypothetical protein